MSLLVPKIRTIFPYPLLYGTIELDHARMVQGFNDPEVDEAVRGIIGKKYLVWIHLMIAGPDASRDDPCRYSVGIVTHSPRRTDDFRGLTAKMFVPIFPNTDPGRERPSVHVIGPDGKPARFPREDCAHWTDGEARVAFMPVPEGLDHTNAYQLPCEGMSLLRETFTRDHVLIPRDKAGSLLYSPPNGSSSRALGTPSSRGREYSVNTSSPPPMEKADGSADHDPSTPVTSFSGTDPFRSSFIPLATISFDIGWISEAGRLPDIYDFFQERDQIQRIIERARCRRQSAFIRRAVREVKMRWSAVSNSLTFGPFRKFLSHTLCKIPS